MGTEAQSDVVIVGAGFAGLTLAAMCADQGLSVVVLERRPRLEPEGVGLVLQPNGLAILERLGVLDAVLAGGQRIIEVHNWHRGRIVATARYDELAHPHPYIVGVPRIKFIDALAARLPPGVALRFGCRVTDLEFAAGRARGVRFVGPAGGEHRLLAECVVGADGVGSAVRAGIGARMFWRTGPDRYVIGIASHPKDASSASLHCGRGWCDGVVPMGDGAYFFDHVSGQSALAVEHDDFPSWRREFARRVPEGDALTAGMDSFQDVAILSGRTHCVRTRSVPGAALVGDAAAAVHPHNGQGANLALEDAWTLGMEVTRRGPTDSALQAYAARRDPRAHRQVPWSILAGRTLDGSSIAWRMNRRWGWTLSRARWFRQLTVRAQAGLL